METIRPLPAVNSPEWKQLQSEVDTVRNSLVRSEKGKIVNSIHNCVTALEGDPVLKDKIRLNVLTGEVDMFGPMFWPRSGIALTDTDQKNIELRLECCYGLTSDIKLSKALCIIANEHRYHPVRDYLSGLVWDGTPRVRFALRHFLGAEVSDFNEECLRVFMLGAVHRVFEPGCKFDLMLCLVGGQGAGKSSFFRLLSCRDEWFSDDLRKLDDENVYRKLKGHWIMEMSEMIATGSARSIEEIKGFLSRQKETYKVPYEVHPEDRPRQCVFAGTTNRMDFLPRDRTGNRRFMPVSVDPEKAEQHPLADEAASRHYMAQMWAEIMAQYRSGVYSLHLSPQAEEHLARKQQEYTQEDTRAGLIYAFIQDYKGRYLCSRQLYREALRKYGDPEDKEIREITEIMHTGIARGYISGWQPIRSTRRFGEYGIQRGWERAEDDGQEPKQLSFSFPPLAFPAAEESCADGFGSRRA